MTRMPHWGLPKGGLPQWVTPGLALVGVLAVGAILMLLTGHDPLSAYIALVRGAVGGRNLANLASTLNRAAPIIGMGLAAALAFRAGFYNLGGEGQLVLGGLAASLAALYLPLPGPLLILAAMLAGAITGGLWAWSTAVFQFRLGVPILISSLLMNYPARFLASYMVNSPFRDVESGMSQTHRIPQAAQLPKLVTGSRLQVTILVIVLAVLVASFVLARTLPGFRMRMAGLNARFARYGGVDIPVLGRRVMFSSGAMAGLVGALQVLAVHHRFIDGALTQPLWAWTGLMAALLVGSRPLGVLVAGLFFAALQTGGLGMERATQVPRELSRVLQALIILMVASRVRARDESGFEADS